MDIIRGRDTYAGVHREGVSKQILPPPKDRGWHKQSYFCFNDDHPSRNDPHREEEKKDGAEHVDVCEEDNVLWFEWMELK